MNTHRLHRTVTRILEFVIDHLPHRRGALAPIVLVINRSEDEVARRRRSR